MSCIEAESRKLITKLPSTIELVPDFNFEADEVTA